MTRAEKWLWLTFIPIVACIVYVEFFIPPPSGGLYFNSVNAFYACMQFGTMLATLIWAIYALIYAIMGMRDLLRERKIRNGTQETSSGEDGEREYGYDKGIAP